MASKCVISVKSACAAYFFQRNIINWLLSSDKSLKNYKEKTRERRFHAFGGQKLDFCGLWQKNVEVKLFTTQNDFGSIR